MLEERGENEAKRKVKKKGKMSTDRVEEKSDVECERGKQSGWGGIEGRREGDRFVRAARCARGKKRRSLALSVDVG
ncbi:hypothetical protein LSTR_LSTR002426 [Laodelphax striatellus]|uniref:Uncharacterized protein n=1 Tax=Laodelphax striatellus TaxID=195883 RepID=A0A482X2T6_LAOST|nr:hypothetical protein LSTR_LSTR002426 [Laodelphax striatellus]